jgi:uncharacterized protein YceK
MYFSRRRSGHVAGLVVALALVAALALAGCSTVHDLVQPGETVTGSTLTFAGNQLASEPATGAQAPTVAPSTATTAPAPPLDAAFATIASRTAMTPEAKQLLARSSPVLANRATLGTSCTLEPDVSVLGCYQSNHITVLNVTDSRLDGLTETTAAHEMLHAAWAGLSTDQRSQLAGWLEAAYQRVTNPELKQRIEVYRNLDPSVVDNELHSILGTEVADLGPDLGAYYDRWFTDRAAVVNLAVAAQGTFTSLKAQVEDLDGQLSGLRAQIQTEERDLASQKAGLEAESAHLDNLRQAGRVEEYNAGVEPFNTAVSSYNDAVTSHRKLVDRHNDLVRQRNDLAAAYTDLAAQIDTTAQSLGSS